MEKYIGSIARFALTGGGAYLATISIDDVQSVIGWISAGLSLFWSLSEKYNRKPKS